MCIIVYFSELDAVIVSGGKTVDQIKAMHACEKKKHADLCNKNCSISCNTSTSWGAAARRAVENKPRCQFGFEAVRVLRVRAFLRFRFRD
jgi:hypothetical protein